MFSLPLSAEHIKLTTRPSEPSHRSSTHRLASHPPVITANPSYSLPRSIASARRCQSRPSAISSRTRSSRTCSRSNSARWTSPSAPSSPLSSLTRVSFELNFSLQHEYGPDPQQERPRQTATRRSENAPRRLTIAQTLSPVPTPCTSPSVSAVHSLLVYNRTPIVTVSLPFECCSACKRACRYHQFS